MIDYLLLEILYVAFKDIFIYHIRGIEAWLETNCVFVVGLFEMDKGPTTDMLNISGLVNNSLFFK
jgi:hypothetical protein